MSHTDLHHNIAANIEMFGWHVTGVFDPKNREAPFAYTVGATTRNLPELIITGLDPRTGCVLINDLLRSIQEGVEIVKEDTPYTELANMPCYLRKLTRDQVKDHMTITCNYHEDTDFDCYQLVYPDPHGLLPWQPGYDFPRQTILFTR